MKTRDIPEFRCPKSGLPLHMGEVRAECAGEVIEGALVTEDGAHSYPIVRSIPRFVPASNYAASFGYQWQKFAKVQVGGQQKIISKIRFDETCEWPADLRGQRILEAGCGAGRFTEIALDTGADVWSFDMSAAIDACIGNITSPEQRERHHPFQASIYDIPMEKGSFDRIFCLGVLQHCPDVKRAFASLAAMLKPGGELVADCYLSNPWKHTFHLKYRLRPFFKWWRPDILYGFWKAVISAAYDVKSAVNTIPWVGPRLASLIRIGRLNYEPEYHFTIAEIKEIKTLSVFDMLSPQYDQPQRMESFRRWCRELNLEIVKLKEGYNGINVRCRMSK